MFQLVMPSGPSAIVGISSKNTGWIDFFYMKTAKCFEPSSKSSVFGLGDQPSMIYSIQIEGGAKVCAGAESFGVGVCHGIATGTDEVSLNTADRWCQSGHGWI